MNYFVVYQYVGKREREDYHCDYYDWVRLRDCRDMRHALVRFWNFEECGYFNYHREHKKDFKIIDIKTFDNLEDEQTFMDLYWNGVPKVF